MTSIRKASKLAAASAVLALSTAGLTACGVDDGTYVLHYTTYTAAASDQSRTVQRWAKEVEQLTDGGVSVEFHYTESLVKADEAVQATLDGRADMAQVGSIYAASDLSMFTAVELPFETQNPRVQMTAINRLYAENTTYREDFERQGVHQLFPIPLGIDLVGTKKPVKNLADLKGLNIRSGGLNSDALVTIGANPVAMTATDIYESLERGIVDGYTSLAIANLPTFGLGDTTKYILDPGIGSYASSIAVINEELLDSMPQEYQDAIDVSSSHAIDNGLEEMDALGDVACTQLKKSGATFSSLPDEEVEQWRKAAKIDAGWVDRNTERGYDAASVLADYRRIIAEETPESDYADPLVACMNGATS